MTSPGQPSSGTKLAPRPRPPSGRDLHQDPPPSPPAAASAYAVTQHGIPRLHVKGGSSVIDANNDRVLFQKNPERILLPTASLTKLVTMMVFMQTNPE